MRYINVHFARTATVDDEKKLQEMIEKFNVSNVKKVKLENGLDGKYTCLRVYAEDNDEAGELSLLQQIDNCLKAIYGIEKDAIIIEVKIS